MLTDADLWRVRCSPINSGITLKVKKTPGPRVSGPPLRPLPQTPLALLLPDWRVFLHMEVEGFQ